MNKGIEESDPFGPFNFNEFKKWMENHGDQKKKNLLGLQVESKLNIRRLLTTIQETKEGNIETVAKDFKKNGGIISEVDGNDVVVKVNSGSFIIHKMYVKKPD